MEYFYEIYKFRFIDSKTKNRCVIYARTEETALKIIEKWNDIQNIFHWIKPRFRFRKKYFITIPPYELEQEQISTIEGWIEYTKNHSND